MGLTHSTSVPASRIEALLARKQELELKLSEELRHPSVSDFELAAIKRRKLKIKEELELLRQAS